MKKETLKALLVRDKVFLRDLYEGPNPLKNNRILNNANDNQLNTLINYLHFVSKGEIKISKKNFDEILKCKKINLLRTYFENKTNLNNLLNGERSNKIIMLKKLSIVMPNLLFGLFNLI